MFSFVDPDWTVILNWVKVATSYRANLHLYKSWAENAQCGHS